MRFRRPGCYSAAANRSSHEFTPGNAFVVPKGYTGTWEQFGDYRELAVIKQQVE